MLSKKIKTAIIGYGFSAKTFHIPFITKLDEFELVAVSTSQKEQLHNDFPEVVHFDDAQALCSESDAELVIITAPNDVHYSLAKLALENNKHVVLEKPFVTKVEDGKALIALAQKHNKVLSVYQNRRWDGDFLTIKKMLDEGQFGELKHFESHFDRFRPNVRERWREQAADGGGILYDLGPHLIDQALALFGLPEKISAQCEIMRPGSNNFDYINVILHYPNHQAVLHADLFGAGPNRRFTIKGSAGSYEKVGLDPQEQRLIASADPSQADWADESPEQYGLFYTSEGSSPVTTERGGYQNYFAELAQSINNGTEAPVSAIDALWNIKLIELAMQSSESGSAITITEDLL